MTTEHLFLKTSFLCAIHNFPENENTKNTDQNNEVAMKRADYDKAIPTIPKGVYECGLINQPEKNRKTEHLKEISTDVQGNGYPADKTNGKKED